MEWEEIIVLKKLLVGMVIVIGLLTLVVLLLPFLLDLNRYRDQYLPILEQALHRKIEVQDVRLTLIPKLGVRLKDVRIADDPTFSPTPFVTVPSVQIVVLWAPLLQRRIQVESVVIQDPTVHVIRSKKGTLNMATIGKDPASTQPTEQPFDPENSLMPFLGVFGVKRFSMMGGTLKYVDQSPKISRAYVIENLELHTESVQIGQTAIFRAKGTMIPYRMPFQVKGRLGPLQSNLDISEINVVVNMGNVVATAQGKLRAGRLELDLQIPNANTDDIPVELGLEKPVGLQQLHAHLSAQIISKTQSFSFSEVTIDSFKMNLELGESIIQLSGKGTPSRFSLVGETLFISSQDLPISFAIQQPFSLEQVKFETVIRGKQIDLVSLTTKAFGGTLEAQGKWEGTPSFPVFFLQGRFQDFSAESLLKVFRPSAVRMTGRGDFQWKVSGVLLPSGSPQLKGPAQLRLRDGNVVGFDLIQAIEQALRMPGVLGESTGVTNFSRIEAKTDLKDKGLFIQYLEVEAPNFSLQGAGMLRFDQSVDLQGRIAVPRAIADQVIQRFPQAKLVLRAGQLELPFVVKGTVQNPVLGLDTRSLGNQIQKNVEKRLEKVLQGDNQELKNLLKDGQEFLKQFFRK